VQILSWGFLGIFAFSFLLYLIPFISPAPMFLAGAIAVIYRDYSPLSIGIAVSAGASIAKMAMYYLTYFAETALSTEKLNRLMRYGNRIGRWKFVAAFISSATPIPDEPVLISLALLRYSPLRFLLAFFLGKLVIVVPGAYLGKGVRAHLVRYGIVGDLEAAIISVIFTVVITVILLKVDLEKLYTKWVQRQERKP